MTTEQKNCIEYMVLGHMSLEDACAICNCSAEDFETEECKAYEQSYSEAFEDWLVHIAECSER